MNLLQSHSGLSLEQLQHQHIMSQLPNLSNHSRRHHELENGFKRYRGAGEEKTSGSSSNSNSNGHSSSDEPLGSPDRETMSKHPLYSHGVCCWTGCDASCDTYSAFINHLTREHILDERSTAQTRVQVCDTYFV